MVYAGVFVCLVVGLLILPREVAQWAFIGAILVSWRVVASERNLHREFRVPAISRLPAWVRYSLEIAFVLLVIVTFSAHLWDWSPEMGIHGQEISYLANSGLISGAVFQRTGTLPLWNPLMGTGEPLVEGPFSFVLNPIMLAPFMWLPALQAIKLSVLIHLLLAGIGGWVLGYTLRFHTAGRLMLACLLAGNGSFTGAIGGGVYQMGLSQAYVIWVYASLFGMLYRPSRAYAGLLVISATLLISAGTFWYALPTALGCLIITAFAIIRRDEAKKWRVDGVMFRRVAWAGVLILGLSAARWLPALVNNAYLNHPREGFVRPLTWGDLLGSYGKSFIPYVANIGIEFHYILPPLFALLICALMLSLWRGFSHLPALTVSRARLLTVSIALIALFSVWGYGDLPLIRALYARFDLLSHWRILERMLAAATPFIALILALLFDDTITLLRRHSATNILRMIGVVVVIVVGVVATVDVLGNFKRTIGISPENSFNRAPLLALREAHPDGILSVATDNFFDYLPFYDTLTRADFANPDIRVQALPSTIGNRYTMQLLPRYALGITPEYVAYLREVGYRPTDYVHPLYGADVLWEHDNAPEYAFVTPVHQVAVLRRLGRDVTDPVSSYSHHFDSIEVRVPNSYDDRVLVVQETAYPGWTVTIDGQSAQLEVIGTFLGVRLPTRTPTDAPTLVEFHYRPRWFYIGAIVTLFSAGVLAAYLLRVDRFFSRDDA